MTTRHFLTVSIAVMYAAMLCATASSLRAQPSPEACIYTRCALGIAPVWNGLLVTRGASQQRVANLGFFWTSTLAAPFAGNDSALVYANRAVRVRRVAAVLTDVGVLALGYTAVRAATQGRLVGSDRIVAVAGGSVFAVSVPLQFAADGLLSRAVWWRNTEYSGR